MLRFYAPSLEVVHNTSSHFHCPEFSMQTHLTAKESRKCLALGPRVKGDGHGELLATLCQGHLAGSVYHSILRSSPNGSGSQISKGEEFTPTEHVSGSITWYFNSCGNIRAEVHMHLPLGQIEGQLEEKIRMF